jgi:hypothetical protein
MRGVCRCGVSERGGHLHACALFLLVAQQPQGFANDLAGITKLAGAHLAGHELLPRLGYGNIHAGNSGRCH